MGSSQRTLWAILKTKLDSWEKDTPNRRFDAIQRDNSISVGNNRDSTTVWDTEAEAAYYETIRHPDPTLAVTLRSPDTQEVLSLFLQLFAIFEPTFPTTRSLKLWIDYPRSDSAEVFLPLIRCFPSFETLCTLYLTSDSHSFIFPLLQRISESSSGSVLLPFLHTIIFINADFRPSSGSLARVSSFLQWRRERGFPIHNIDIIESWIDREYIQSQLQDVGVGMDVWNDTGTED
jgi:hypothetical protein